MPPLLPFGWEKRMQAIALALVSSLMAAQNFITSNSTASSARAIVGRRTFPRSRRGGGVCGAGPTNTPKIPCFEGTHR